MTGDNVPDDELFRAAVSCSLRRGKLKTSAGVDPEQSRATEQTFVLVAIDGRVIDRLPLQMVEREAVKLQDTHLPDIAGWLEGPNGKLFGTIALLVLLGGLVMRCSSSMRTVEPVSTPPAKPDNTWIPSGFTRWDEGLAFRWGEQGDGPGCIGDQTCFRVEIVPKVGCDSLYVAVSLLDAGGRNIGYTNDSTQGVRAGEMAVLTLGTHEEAMQTMRISEIVCR